MSSPSVRGEAGFTLVEVLAASLLLLVGILGVAASLDISRTSINSSEVRESATHRAERELERIRALPYTSLGLVELPSGSAEAGHPASYVQSGGYQWNEQDPSKVEPFVVGGAVASKQQLDDGRLKADLFVYITAYDDPAVTAAVAARRVIVSVVPSGSWKLRRPVVASTIVPAPLP